MVDGEAPGRAGGVLLGFRTLVGPVLVSEGPRIAVVARGGCQLGGPWLFKGISSRDIRCSPAPHAAVNQAEVCWAKNSSAPPPTEPSEASIVAAVASPPPLLSSSGVLILLF